MSRVDERVWQKLVNAFRDSPGNFRNASRVASVDRTTARKAWCVGYPKVNRKPIQEMLRVEEEERAALVRARAESVRTETEAFAAAMRKDVRGAALEEYERTGQYLKAAAMTATNTLVATHRLQPVVTELGSLAGRLVETVHREITQGEMSAPQALGMLEKIASIMKAVAATSNSATMQGAKVVELSRQRLGEMNGVVEQKAMMSSEPFDAAEARRLAEELAAAAEDADGGPVLSVLPGGDGKEG